MFSTFRRDFDYVTSALGDPEFEYCTILDDRPAMIGYWCRHVAIFDMAPLAHWGVAIMLGGRAGARYRVDEDWSEREAAPGSVQFIPANTRVFWRINGELDLLTVQFRPSAQACAMIGRSEFIDDLQFAVPDALSLSLGLSIAGELGQPADDMTEGHLKAMVGALCGHLETIAIRRIRALQPSNGRRSFRRAAVSDFVGANLERGIEIDEIARLFDVSASYVFRFFKTEFGMTPHAFITRARVTRACELLQSTRVSLAELADQVGFASQSHFSRVFKQHLGETPQQYRRRIAE
ncbi:AraC family transcriptional regulator [Zavarzinia compransoris]|uniref:helix-turn-helix transcriptional regulator n=1 Tax=Zavarzinia marina TaxID=2911065 RepID=UPI001F32BA0C|nr:AraC family transcriptional regulator [Zavarzinia marina]MCF4165278.1 AraC family transcriptional regulator [Zavarzinia marina]